MVIKNGRASIALDLLLQTYRSIQPASEALFPVINSSDQEELTNLICAVSLAGDASQWGVAIPVFTSLAGFLRYLGAETLSETRGIENGVLSQAVMVCLRSVPERRVGECVRLIRNVVNAADFLENDWSTVRSLDSDEVCRVVRQITAEPVSQHLITQIFGTVYGGAAITTRARPSGGSASLLCRLQAIDWHPRPMTRRRLGSSVPTGRDSESRDIAARRQAGCHGRFATEGSALRRRDHS